MCLMLSIKYSVKPDNCIHLVQMQHGINASYSLERLASLCDLYLLSLCEDLS
jgi:hypothetical protein